MKFTECDDDGLLIQGYGPAGVRVRGRDYAGGVLVCAETLVSPWGPASAAALTAADLAGILDSAVAAWGLPQVVILGTGARQHFPAPPVLATLLGRGIGVEVMGTGAACRTYNILVGEGRRVVAALLDC